eukprot:c11491_g1_i1.p1 GENE.c11491_g1_i1~~c11491_g1_i1.p1  ORF type:complete len:188 (+),score=60.28 c11491_g1_i1:33-596(+)
MELKGKLFELRPWETRDIPHLSKVANNFKVSQYLRDRFPYPYTEKDAQDRVEKSFTEDKTKSFSFAIVDIETNTPIGGVGAERNIDVHYRNMEIGYWLGEEFWGKGIMTEALSLFIDYTFENYKDVLRLEAYVVTENIASVKTLHKLGFVTEGTHRQAVVKNGKVFDRYSLALIRDDYYKAHPEKVR